MHSLPSKHSIRAQKSVFETVLNRIASARQSLCGLIKTVATKVKAIHWTQTNLVKAGLVAVAATGAAYCLIRAAQKIFTKSHATILKEAGDALEQACGTYQPLIAVLQYHYGTNFGPSYARTAVNEDVLATLALGKNSETNGFIRALNATIKNLGRHVQYLQSRLDRTDDPALTCDMRMSFVTLAGTITTELGPLNILRDYVSYHSPYFELYDRQASICGRHGNGTMPLPIPAVSSAGPFPRLEYNRILDRDLRALLSINQKNATLYPRRGNEVREVYENLLRKKDELEHSQEYTEEFRAREQQRLQRRQLHEQQKTNDLLVLGQRRNTLTAEEYERERRTIELRYCIYPAVDFISSCFGY
jgi:hypothetical protein